MADIRWHRISAALAARGHTVHMASAELHWRFRRSTAVPGTPAFVPITRLQWDRYDMVKTLFHLGFETLERHGGAGHPFIVSKLGSVVGPDDRPGIYFYGAERARMFGTQTRIAATSRAVTLLSQPAIDLWRECHGASQRTLLVPGAVDAVVPPPGRDPYPAGCRIRCVFSGNFYRHHRSSQPEAHNEIAARLNAVGALLHRRGARLFVVGPGDARSLDERYVSWCGAVAYERSWDWLHFASVGIVVAAGAFMHNNESTKIYHYLRAGLPVVSEEGFPNDDVVRGSGLGFVVPNGEPQVMADRILEASAMPWDRARAVQFILERHTWDRRVEAYERLLAEEGFAPPGGGPVGH